MNEELFRRLMEILDEAGWDILLPVNPDGTDAPFDGAMIGTSDFLHDVSSPEEVEIELEDDEETIH